MKSIEAKVRNATKWSVAAEIAGKLIAPISNIILARLLTPEAFGVVATVTMITSFADMFTDAGFQKYLVQHEFDDVDAKWESTNVAFWTNLLISLFFWGVIFIFRDSLAEVVGNPGLGNVFAIACVSLPLTSFSSIQMALFRREFDFKSLFIVRMVTILIPLFVTVPLAFITRSYWALIIGTITINLASAVLLTIRSEWKPYLYYSISKLKEMFSFSCWSLIEQISIWLTSYIGTFIVGSILSTYYVGIYKTSMTTVNQITSLITSATTPVLFAALSRAQNDESSFSSIFFGFQKGVSVVVIPLGVGMFLYKDLITQILLGNQWGEAASFIGLWGLMSAFTIVFSHFSSEVYRAKGRPRLSFFVQCSHLVILVPVLIITAKIDFRTLYIARSLVRFELIFINMLIMWRMFRISPLNQIRNCLPEMICAVIMGICSVALLAVSKTLVWQFFTIGICIIVYFSSILLFSEERKLVLSTIKRYKEKLVRKA